MTNKYLTKIAALIYPRITHTEFDAAFEGAANPTRDGIEEEAHRRDYGMFKREHEEWAEDLDYLLESKAPHQEIRNFMDQEPNFENYRGETLKNLYALDSYLRRREGQEVPGPSKVGLGLGYGAGVAAILGGLALKNPGLGMAGAAGLGLTGLIHSITTPEERYRSHVNLVNDLNNQKMQLLQKHQKDAY